MTRKELARKVLEDLRRVIPNPETELVYLTPYELIVAVVLSAQCTDERVNKVTPDLFRQYPDVRAMSKAEPEDIYPYIRSISYPNNKSKHLAGLARKVVRDFNGTIPDTVDELVKLNGVGRKTAQVVASVAFGKPALPVDTHVFRVANRIGITKNAKTAHHVEKQLKRTIPREAWGEAHHLLILHGRYTCTARSPQCAQCPLPGVCSYEASLRTLARPIKGLDTKKGRYYCKTRGHYFDIPTTRQDRSGLDQVACPNCHSMQVFDTRTGLTTKRVEDYRI